MTMDKQHQAANIIAPLINVAAAGAVTARNRCAAIAIAGASGTFDLTTYLQPGVLNGHYLTAQADGGDVFLFFNNVNAGTVDETVTTAGGVTACWKIPNGTVQHFCIPQDYTWLVAKGSVACKLRIYVSSIAADETIGERI